MELIKDIYLFISERKKYWLMPVIIVLMLLGVLIAIGTGSPVGAFIYTLF